jgi:probable rRNA maturation factor
MEPEEEKEMFGLQSTLLEGWRSTPRDPVTGEPTAAVTARPPVPPAVPREPGTR